MTKEEIKKAILNKELSINDVLLVWMKIKKINTQKKIEDFLSDTEDMMSNYI
jgi:hypothetical protein